MNKLLIENHQISYQHGGGKFASRPILILFGGRQN